MHTVTVKVHAAARGGLLAQPYACAFHVEQAPCSGTVKWREERPPQFVLTPPRLRASAVIGARPARQRGPARARHLERLAFTTSSRSPSARHEVRVRRRARTSALHPRACWCSRLPRSRVPRGTWRSSTSPTSTDTHAAGDARLPLLRCRMPRAHGGGASMSAAHDARPRDCSGQRLPRVPVPRGTGPHLVNVDRCAWHSTRLALTAPAQPRSTWNRRRHRQRGPERVAPCAARTHRSGSAAFHEERDTASPTRTEARGARSCSRPRLRLSRVPRGTEGGIASAQGRPWVLGLLPLTAPRLHVPRGTSVSPAGSQRPPRHPAMPRPCFPRTSPHAEPASPHQRGTARAARGARQCSRSRRLHVHAWAGRTSASASPGHPRPGSPRAHDFLAVALQAGRASASPTGRHVWTRPLLVHVTPPSPRSTWNQGCSA